jgi:predicted dehydrogenase
MERHRPAGGSNVTAADRRVRIGVIGCGAIAQVQHLPFLSELAEEFELAAVCDVSAGAADYAARLFHVPRKFTDHREMLTADIDAVLLCHSDPKTAAIIDCLNAGKHVLVEKPICFSPGESAAINEAISGAGKVAMAGYMKLYEPAFERARAEVAAMEDVRFVQVNHLHPSNDLHVAQFRTRRFNDIPASTIEHNRAARDRAVHDAIGAADPAIIRAFGLLSGSLIHDLYGLRALFGQPDRVVSTEIWRDGGALSTTLQYGPGFRCVATWVDLPDLWDFRETLEVYGSRKRVLISYETGFSRAHSKLRIHGIDESGSTFKSRPALAWESPFRRELRHFHACITQGARNRSPICEAGADIDLIIEIVRTHLERS